MPYLPYEFWHWPPVIGGTYAGGQIYFSHSDSLPVIKNPRSGKACVVLDMAWGKPNHILGNGKPSFTHRGYIYTELKKPLIPGRKYTISFHIKRRNYNESAVLCTNCIQILFSTEIKVRPRYISSSPLPIYEQAQINYDTIVDTVWTKIQQTFTADSSFKYMSVGNFEQDTLLNFIRLDSGNISKNPFVNGNNYAFDDFSLLPAWLYITGDSAICLGESATLHAFNHHGTTMWAEADRPNQIISEDSIVSFNPEKTTTYILYSEVDTAVFTVKIKDYSVDLGGDTTICTGEKLTLFPFLPGASFKWFDGTLRDSIVVDGGGIYTVRAFIDGCMVSDSMRLFEKNCDCNVSVPNAFTPNNDELNDVFKVSFGCMVKTFNLIIYNRWGEIVFETYKSNQSWDGSSNGNQVPGGMYAYKLEFTLGNGDKGDFQGKVLVLR